MTSLKAYRWLIAMILIIFLGGYLALSFVPGMLATQMSLKLDVPVQMGRMGFTPWSISLNQLHIGNSENGILPEAFSAQSIQSKALLTEYLKDKITLESLTIEDIYLGLEFDSIKGTKGNWTEIMSNLEAQKNENSQKSHSEKKSILIKTLSLKNIKTDVLYRDGNSGVIHLPPIKEIVLHNVSSEGGMLTDQLMSSVLGQMLKSVFVQENLKNMLDQLFQPKQHLDNLLSPFKGLFNFQRPKPQEVVPAKSDIF